VPAEVERIAAGVRWFAETALRLGQYVEPEVVSSSEIAEGQGETSASHASREEAAAWMGQPNGSGTLLAAEALHLPVAVLRFPEALQKAARSVLPSGDVQVPEAKVWAPVLGWLALRGLPSAQAALSLYDELQLRHALAETFSSVGVKGEDAWRAAAQVRVLLRVEAAASLKEALETAAFWDDADVRWLTGTHGDEEGVAYFEQERLEALACWLELPGLVAALPDVAMAIRMADVAKAAGYKVKPFVEMLVSGETAEVKAVEVVETKVPVVKGEKVAVIRDKG
jgi:hypothetical protein